MQSYSIETPTPIRCIEDIKDSKKMFCLEKTQKKLMIPMKISGCNFSAIYCFTPNALWVVLNKIKTSKNYEIWANTTWSVVLEAQSITTSYYFFFEDVLASRHSTQAWPLFVDQKEGINPQVIDSDEADQSGHAETL